MLKTDTTTKAEYLSVTKLKERGWTDALIRKYLEVPDKFCKNPFYSKGSQMHLYRTARVEAFESSTGWVAVLEKIKPRRISATKAVQTKTERLLAAVAQIEIVVPALSLPQVVQDACDAYNHFHNSLNFDHDWSQASVNSDSVFLDRITVNYLRHQLTSYEEELSKTFGKVGVKEAYKIINQKIYAAISESYPVLAQECKWQLRTKNLEDVLGY